MSESGTVPVDQSALRGVHPVQVVLAAVLGGFVCFNAGYVDHMVFTWVERAITKLPDEALVVDTMKKAALEPGVYIYPQLPANFATLQADERAIVMNEVNERYKTGPAGFLVVPPTGQDMMGPTQLGGEFGIDCAAALLAAIVVSQAVGASFLRRWLIVVILALFSWVATLWSYNLWYRFPSAFVLDELFCALFEWSLTGLVIAAIVVAKRPAKEKTQLQQSELQPTEKSPRTQPS